MVCLAPLQYSLQALTNPLSPCPRPNVTELLDRSLLTFTPLSPPSRLSIPPRLLSLLSASPFSPPSPLPSLTSPFSPPSPPSPTPSPPLPSPPSPSSTTHPSTSPCTHQKTGHLLCKFPTRHALTSTTPPHTPVTGTKNQPNPLTSLSTAASKAVAPAGGCTVPVACMSTMASAVARAPRRGSSCVKVWEGRRRKSFVRAMEVRAARRWPRIKGRGWARGEERVL